MPRYATLAVLALAASTVSPVLSAPVQEVRGQSLSHRGLLSGITELISKIFKPKAKSVKVHPETAPAPAPVKENLEAAPPPAPVKENLESAPPPPPPAKENQANPPSEPAPGVPAPGNPGVPPKKSKLKSYAKDFVVGTGVTVAGSAALGYMAGGGATGQEVVSSTYPTDANYQDNSTYPIDSTNPDNSTYPIDSTNPNNYDNSNNPVNPQPANPGYYANPSKNVNSNYYANPTYTNPNGNYQRRALVHGLRAGLFKTRSNDYRKRRTSSHPDLLSRADLEMGLRLFSRMLDELD